MKKKDSITIGIFGVAGGFAENKDKARRLREEEILPALAAGKNVILDFRNVESTTQSFTHALLSQAIRDYGDSFFDRVVFTHCAESVKKVITIVAEYMQRSTTPKPPN